MYRLYGNSLRDQARAHHLPVLAPGEKEPVWLRHRVELEAALAEMRTVVGSENPSNERVRPGRLVTRIRVALRLS